MAKKHNSEKKNFGTLLFANCLASKTMKNIQTKNKFRILKKIKRFFPSFSLFPTSKQGPKCSEMFAELQDRTSNTSEHLNLAQNRTSNLPNITKTRTVREHRTVCSNTSMDRFTWIQLRESRSRIAVKMNYQFIALCI